MFSVVSRAWHRLSVSWRPLTTPGSASFFRDHDAVIAVEDQGAGRRGNTYEVYTFGEQIATRQTLAEAKAEVESVYGPLRWERKELPLFQVEHNYFGPTTEFTDPTTIYVVDHLPRL